MRPEGKKSLVFLGTGGSRFTIMHQLRASGGLWFDWKGFPVVIDPGPGSLVRMRQHNPPLNPETIEAILVTHKHLDHTTDLNVLTEAMTGGGFKKRGTVLLPADTLEGGEPVLYKYLQEKMHHLGTWDNDSPSQLGGGRSVRAVPLTHHGVECYGLVFTEDEIPLWGLVSDTRYDREWPESFHGCRLLVVNMTLARGRANLEHLAPEHVAAVVESLSPELTILTHFGRGVLKQGPELIAENIGNGRSRVVAAKDGMLVDVDTLEIRMPSPEDS